MNSDFNKEFGKKITIVRKSSNITMKELADKVGLAESTIQRYEAGKIKGVDVNIVKKIAEALNTPATYFMGWEKDTEDKKAIKKQNSYKIPVYGEIAAGIPIEIIEDIIDYEEVDEHTFNRGDLIALKIRGDSMEPRICSGDVVILRLQSDVNNGEIAAVQIDGESATLKQIKKEKNGIYLIPFNNVYDTKFYTNDEILELPIKIIGKVIELRGKF